MENNENKEIEQVTDVSSLISLCERTENLPVIQQLALKQRISFRFEYTLHGYMRNEGEPSNKFATYITLLETKPQLYGNVCDILTEEFVSEEVVEECLMYIRSGIIPYHLWTDKIIHDLRDTFYYKKSSISGMLTVYLGKTLKASLIAFNKLVKALEENEDILTDEMKNGINFVKMRAFEMPQGMKEKYMKMFATHDEQERIRFQENETTIFTETLIDMLKYPFNQEVLDKMEEGTSSPFEDFWITPMFGGGSTLVSYARGAGNTMQQDVSEQQEQQGGMGSWWEMLGFGPNGETPEEMERQRELEKRQVLLTLNNKEETKENDINIWNFHWDNPQFKEFLTRYEIDGTGIEADMYDSSAEIDRDYIEFHHADLINENLEEGDPEWFSDDDITEMLIQVRRFKPHAELAYRRFVEQHRQEQERQRITKVNEKFEQRQTTKVISNEHNIKYCVKKVAKDSSQRVMSENWFDTEKQAQEFIDDITRNNPMMSRAFEFKIEPGVHP